MRGDALGTPRGLLYHILVTHIISIQILQAGMSWELIVYQFFVQDQETNEKWFETQVHDVILSDESLQDAHSVVPILEASLRLFKKMNPQITEIYIRSDNAGNLCKVDFLKTRVSQF